MAASVRVVSAKESADRDLAAIRNGTPSRVLMERAGRAAAHELQRRYHTLLERGTVIYTGPGNNGGDGWVTARALIDDGLPVLVREVAAAKTADAVDAKSAVNGEKAAADFDAAPVVIDALLGTGSEGEPRGAIGDAVREINDRRRAGACVAALDIPSGLNATTGEHGSCVFADITLSFGGVKRGTLLARDCAGDIVVLDIGLDENADVPNSDSECPEHPTLVDSDWVHSRIPPIHYNAHKGIRKHLAVIGGAGGMPGAAVLATRAALRSGIGLVKAFVAAENLPATVAAAPSALISPWPDDGVFDSQDLAEWPHAIVVGPGLGKSVAALKLLDQVLSHSSAPLLLDADAINVFAGNTAGLGEHLSGRQALLTPHPAEFARLAGVDVDTVLAQRFDIGVDVARRTNATILLKGTPTIISTPTGSRYVVARGSAALATGGSGDLLAGIAGTLLAQTGNALSAACCAAWIHGRAAEFCAYIRGTTLEDVLYALPRAWNERERTPPAPVLAELPAVSQ